MYKELFSLKGKVAIVTGASKGIGLAIATAMAEHGATVVVSSRKQEAVDAAAKTLVDNGHTSAAIECNVGYEDQCKVLIEKTMELYGRIDILVNNAGTNPYYGPVSKMPMEAYQKTLNVNLNSAINLSNLVYPIMKAQKGGSIIHISSVEGLHPSKNMTAYNISKTALIMLGNNQAIEWGKHNIRVNSICPGYVETKLSAGLLADEASHARLIRNVALKRPGQPHEMAGLAVFLASDASSYMTGSAIVNDGGLLHAPML